MEILCFGPRFNVPPPPPSRAGPRLCDCSPREGEGRRQFLAARPEAALRKSSHPRGPGLPPGGSTPRDGGRGVRGGSARESVRFGNRDPLSVRPEVTVLAETAVTGTVR